MTNGTQCINLGLFLDRAETNGKDSRMGPVGQCDDVWLELVEGFNEWMQIRHCAPMNIGSDVDIYFPKPHRTSGSCEYHETASVWLVRGQQLSNIINATREIGLFVLFLEPSSDKLD